MSIEPRADHDPVEARRLRPSHVNPLYFNKLDQINLGSYQAEKAHVAKLHEILTQPAIHQNLKTQLQQFNFFYNKQHYKNWTYN